MIHKLEWTTPDSRNTPTTTNLEDEEIVDAPRNDANASMPEQVKRPNPWRKMMMIIIIMKISTLTISSNYAIKVVLCDLKTRIFVSAT